MVSMHDYFQPISVAEDTQDGREPRMPARLQGGFPLTQRGCELRRRRSGAPAHPLGARQRTSSHSLRTLTLQRMQTCKESLRDEVRRAHENTR